MKGTRVSMVLPCVSPQLFAARGPHQEHCQQVGRDACYP
eukprot:COSAG01_NODE_69071_length_262_cov_0.944785_1_plen_38_part_01